MTIYGTSYFVSLQHAIDYYRTYYTHSTAAGLERAVKDKLANGEIHIGAPDFKPGEKLMRIDGGTRYAIERQD